MSTSPIEHTSKHCDRMNSKCHYYLSRRMVLGLLIRCASKPVKTPRPAAGSANFVRTSVS